VCGGARRTDPLHPIQRVNVNDDTPLGILEVLGGGSGFIRRTGLGLHPQQRRHLRGARVINKFGLRTGDELSGDVGKRPKNGKSPPLTHLRTVNGRPPEDARRRPSSIA
jgi:transcription termination factor Rho